MIKLNIQAARVPRMTHAQYARYAKDNHARLVLGTEPVSRYLTAYVQQHVFDAAYGVNAPAWRYDSVSHIYARSAADMHAATATREYREIIAPDEPSFADSRSASFTMLEELPLALPVRGYSSLRLLHYGCASDDGAAATFAGQWTAAHEAVLAHSPRLLHSVRRAVLNRALPGPGGERPAFDVMGELGFLEHSDVPAISDYVALMEEALGSQLDCDRSFFLLAEAIPVRAMLS